MRGDGSGGRAVAAATPQEQQRRQQQRQRQRQQQPSAAALLDAMVVSETEMLAAVEAAAAADAAASGAPDAAISPQARTHAAGAATAAQSAVAAASGSAAAGGGRARAARAANPGVPAAHRVVHEPPAAKGGVGACDLPQMPAMPAVRFGADAAGAPAGGPAGAAGAYAQHQPAPLGLHTAPLAVGTNGGGGGAAPQESAGPLLYSQQMVGGSMPSTQPPIDAGGAAGSGHGMNGAPAPLPMQTMPQVQPQVLSTSPPDASFLLRQHSGSLSEGAGDGMAAAFSGLGGMLPTLDADMATMLLGKSVAPQQHTSARSASHKQPAQRVKLESPLDAPGRVATAAAAVGGRAVEPTQPVDPDGVLGLRWVQSLMEIRNKKPSAGGPIRQCVRDALEAVPGPPSALADRLAFIITPAGGYKSNSAGPCKRAACAALKQYLDDHGVVEATPDKAAERASKKRDGVGGGGPRLPPHVSTAQRKEAEIAAAAAASVLGVDPAMVMAERAKVPREVHVTCNGAKAVFRTATCDVRCFCGECFGSKPLMTPSALEKHVGCAAKKWKLSFRVRDRTHPNGALPLGDWLTKQGVDESLFINVSGLTAAVASQKVSVRAAPDECALRASSSPAGAHVSSPFASARMNLTRSAATRTRAA